MKPQFQHEATTSFALWLDHHLTYKAEAYSNKTGAFYYMPDSRLPQYPDDPVEGLISYNSEYKQWVYDSDAASAIIPSGVYIDTGDGNYNFCWRGESGLRLDFENGRVLLSGALFPTNYNTLNITGSFAVKDINIYLTDDTEENLVIQNKYNVNSRTTPAYGAGTGLAAYEQVAPAAFCSMERTFNSPFALGGEDLTHMYYRVVFFAENLYQLDGAMAVAADSFNMGVTNIGYNDYPLDEYGDLKSQPLPSAICMPTSPTGLMAAPTATFAGFPDMYGSYPLFNDGQLINGAPAWVRGEGAGATGIFFYEFDDKGYWIATSNWNSGIFPFGVPSGAPVSDYLFYLASGLFDADSRPWNLTRDGADVPFFSIADPFVPIGKPFNECALEFSYSTTVKNCTTVPKLMFIDDVKSSKISDRLSKTTNPDLYLGFVDFEVNQARFPRSS